jgi:diguanylate cyclase (GGDEF)-like protein/PAS domain S-box-containing protein
MDASKREWSGSVGDRNAFSEEIVCSSRSQIDERVAVPLRSVQPVVDERIIGVLRAVMQSVGGTGIYLVSSSAKRTVLFREAADDIAWSTYLAADTRATETVRSLQPAHATDASRYVDFDVRLAKPCRLIVIGDHALKVSPAHAYVVRTLLANLEMLAEAENIVPRSERLRLLESIVSNGNDAVLVTDAAPDSPDKRILYANPAFTKSTGYDLAEVIGRTPRMFQGPDTDPAVCARIREALERCEPIEVELLNYKKDGTPFWVELSIVPVADEAGVVTHWVSVQHDTTDRRTARQAALRAAEGEEQRAALEAEINARKDVEAKLAHAAYTDTLTGVANRALFTRRLTDIIEEMADDPDLLYSVLFLDLDRFKFVNDSLGHMLGDLLLSAVAGRLQRCIRDSDTVARIGGDEFSLLVEGPIATGAAVAERIVQAFTVPFVIGDSVIPSSVSIGVATVTAGAAVTDVLRDADAAMYRAKHVFGGASSVVFDETMHANVVTRVRRELDLHSAVGANEFHVEYQPIVNLASGLVEGVEALVRWDHAEEGMLSPDRFIPIAEATGDIVAIGAFVLNRACSDFAARPSMHRPMYVSVNVSSRELDRGDDFIANLRATLERTLIAPANVHIEITEGILLDSLDRTHRIIQAIRALGCCVAFDDFGTGYSNLGYLPRFPIDTLKVDKAFVSGIEQAGVARKIVRTMALLAESLELELVVEGVETPEQATVLVEIGCLKQQGYLYSVPVRRERLEAITADIERRCARSA